MELFSSPGLYFVKNLTVILFLLNRCVQQQVDPIPPNHLAVNGAFITIHEYASKGPKLERRTCRSLLQCGHLCLKNQKCASFNYQTSRVPTGLCELSEGSIVSSEEHSKLNKMPGFVFVQIVRRDLKPRICLDHIRAGSRYSGFYKILDDEGHSFPVYCDLTSDATAVWTLFMSQRIPGRNIYKAVPLYVDSPTSEDNPNWNLYRLSLPKMKQLRARSSHWRVTCGFEVDGVVDRDYVRAKIADLDPIDFKGVQICKRVEYINVRGHSCTDCDAAWWQDDRQMLHYDSSRGGCRFDARSGAVSSEDNFGYYAVINPNFRCTPSSGSTTNYWFGSYLK